MILLVVTGQIIMFFIGTTDKKLCVSYDSEIFFDREKHICIKN